MSARRFYKLWAISTVIVILFVLGLMPSAASAHVRGKPSFLKIQGSFVDYYNVKPFSGARHDYPQSMDINYHLPQQAIDFSIDKGLMSVSYDQVNRMQLDWDFGDGSHGTGFATKHSYQQPGTYELQVHGKLPGAQARLVEATSIQIFPNADYRLPDYTMSVNGKEVFNNTSVNDVRPKQAVTLELIQHDTTAIQSVEWDFGDGESAEGASVTHAYGDTFDQAYPVVRVRFDDHFYSDNQVWLQDPDAKQVATTDPSSAAAPLDINTTTGKIQHKLQQRISSVFKDGKINLSLAIFVLLFAIVAGGLHSLTPGHGKTILATLLAGRTGNRYRDLAILTASITIAHTLVIYVVGFTLLAVSSSSSANTMLPYFERVSAILVIVLALYLIYTGGRRVRNATENNHTHAHKNVDKHHHTQTAMVAPKKSDTWSLVLAGTGGGIVPCIDALSLMLLASGLGHAGFGLVLVLFFSLGLAGTIGILGLIVITGKSRMMLNPRIEKNIGRYAPLASGVIILILAVVTLWP